MHIPRLRTFGVSALLTACLVAQSLGETIRVRYLQGSVHGYVVLKTLEGATIATGDTTQTVHGDRVVSRLVLRFRDGSLDDEEAVFTQRGVFRLISDRHIQRGPSFPTPLDFLINAVTGDLTSRAPDGTLILDLGARTIALGPALAQQLFVTAA